MERLGRIWNSYGLTLGPPSGRHEIAFEEVDRLLVDLLHRW
jgi:hypothetical protein